MPQSIAQEIDDSTEEVIITSGGLGPTSDDKTVEALCFLLKCKKIIHQPSLTRIKKKLARSDAATLDKACRQAYYPQRATASLNPFGLAPLIHFKCKAKIIFSLPGVPKEFNGLLEKVVLPQLSHLPKQLLHRLSVYLHDVVESQVNVKLKAFEKLKKISLAYLPYLGGVNVIATSEDALIIERLKVFINKHYYSNIISLTGEDLSEWFHHHFSQVGLKIGFLESCTGGLIISRLVSRSGSSAYIDGGIVSYSNGAKESLLEVPRDLLEKHGAVSKPVAKAMLLYLINRRNLDAGISVTGIAGPSGGTQNKPVGTVYIGIYYKKQLKIKKHLFSGDRNEIRERTFWAALNDLRLLIKTVDGV